VHYFLLVLTLKQWGRSTFVCKSNRKSMAKRSELHEQIKLLSAKLLEFNENFRNQPELQLLDIDLLRKNTIELYEAINLLRLSKNDFVESETSLKQPADSIEDSIQILPVDNRVSIIQPAVEEIPEIITELPIEKVVPKEIEPSLPKTIELFETEPLVKVQDALQKAEPEPEVIAQVSEPEAETKVKVEEIIEEKQPAVIERIRVAEQTTIRFEEPKKEEKEDIATRYSGSPLEDLKKAISIAKKFEFINALFQANVEAYSRAIHNLNMQITGDDAFNHLNRLREEYNWEEEDENYLELADLVRRRFLKR